MKIGLYTIAYTPGGYTTKQLDSILPYSQHEIITKLFLHNGRSEELIEECEKLTQKYNLQYYSYGINRGISLSHNEATHDFFDNLHCDIVIGGGQDVYFKSNDAFDIWIESAKTYIEDYYYIGNKTCLEDNAIFGLCITTPQAWQNVGCSDENFFPAQYEEIDLCRRAKLIRESQNYKIGILTNSIHDSMLSRRKDMSLFVQQTYITYPLCQVYYIRKWGGDIGYETYLYPFNDESIGYYIPWEKHKSPYGQYDRQDQGIIRI